MNVSNQHMFLLNNMTVYTLLFQAQVVSSHVYQNGDTESSEAQFLSALQGSLEIFVNRMRSNSQRGRPIANDSAVQSLFAVISDMHPQLMTHIQEKEEDRGIAAYFLLLLLFIQFFVFKKSIVVLLTCIKFFISIYMCFGV